MTNSWICDSCGGDITTTDDGWVEWFVFKDTKKMGRDIRIVHANSASPIKSGSRCQYDEKSNYQKDEAILRDLSLSDLVGPNGLMQLLSMIAENELPKDQVLEIIKRIHIPGYEKARKYFDRAIYEGVFEPNTPKGYYWQSDINATLKAIDKLQD